MSLPLLMPLLLMSQLSVDHESSEAPLLQPSSLQPLLQPFPQSGFEIVGWTLPLPPPQLMSPL
eukprot:CAMPEP_0170392842 /NCGR_PEP_ID=MMETSP0117_2-20130122/20406_1 /TAXON_ID=400756 /ORGANISM="Durinskia baltica, Strain CSIRO CS-38" /LENGTH=62 /DNA_ID=CAMNT_0010649003 /DNA_START=51 /DNA_END=236 /DNA_ORIENTATION=+